MEDNEKIEYRYLIKKKRLFNNSPNIKIKNDFKKYKI